MEFRIMNGFIILTKVHVGINGKTIPLSIIFYLQSYSYMINLRSNL